MAKVLEEMESLYETIYNYRIDIASHTRDKVEKKASAWEYTGDIKLAKAKEDFVRSQVAEENEKISFCEAEIERAYNKIKLLELSLEDV